MPDRLSTSKELASALGGGSGAGYQIVKFRRPRKKYPDWVNSNEKITEILLRAFPLMHSRPKQRERAGRWARVIYLFFRRQWTRGQIAEEMGLTYGHVNTMILGIKRVAAGRRYDGRGDLKRHVRIKT
jgi:hypothetical protein